MYDTDNKPHVHDLARAVVAHMPDGWTVSTPYDHAANLVDPDGVTLHVRIGNYGAEDGRLVITGSRPDGASYSDGDTHGIESGRITVAADRDAAAIAREIVRRLLPTASDAWRQVADRIARREANARARHSLAVDLAGIMGSAAREFRGDWRAELPGRLSGRPGVRGTWGDMTPDYDGESVRAELRGLSPEQARDLARLVASWPDAGADA